jgi:hypothetical protein
MNTFILLTAAALGQPMPPTTLPAIPTPGAIGQPMPPAGDMPPANGKGNGNCADEKPPEPEKPEPYALMRLLSTTQFGQRMADNGWSVSGWVEGNYTLGTARRSNLPVTFNDRVDFWQMNQNFLRIDKAIDTDKNEFQLGGRAELILPGTDSRFTIARGLFDQQLRNGANGGARKYPVDLFQAYGEAFLPNLGPKGTTVRVGKFATHVGYELVQGAETPFLQRSYLFQYNPFTHTGAWAITPLNDTWTVSNGLALGSDNFIDSTNRLTYLGQLKWAPKDGKSTVAVNVVVTDPRYDRGELFPHYNVYNVVFTRTLTEKLSYVLDGTFSHIDGLPSGAAAPSVVGGPGSATWYGAAQYLIYKHSDTVTSTARVELFEDTKGFRTGARGLYTEVTYGVAWAPKPGLIFRPTVRYDHNNSSRPFEGKANLFTAAFDVILRY